MESAVNGEGEGALEERVSPCQILNVNKENPEPHGKVPYRTVALTLSITYKGERCLIKNNTCDIQCVICIFLCVI